MPPQIGFDIGVENVELPSPKFTFYVDAAGDAMAKFFLVEYFSYYDSGNRQQLEIAYHDRALFSLTAKFDKLRQDESLFVLLLFFSVIFQVSNLHSIADCRNINNSIVI